MQKEHPEQWDVRRDPRDKELAQVVDVDLTMEEPLRVRQQSAEARREDDWWDEETLVDTYPEHVIGHGEVWRAKRDARCFCTDHGMLPVHLITPPAFTGFDALVLSASFSDVTYRTLRVPMAADSDAFCSMDEPTTLPLRDFLEQMEFLCKEAGYLGAPPYVPSDKERAAHAKEVEKSQTMLRLTGLPQEPELTKIVALGMLSHADIQAARTREAAGSPRGRDWEGLKAEGGEMAELVGIAEISEKAKRGELPPEQLVGALQKLIDMEMKQGGVRIEDAPPDVKESYEKPFGSLPRDTNNNGRTESMSDEPVAKKQTAADFKEVALANEGHQLVLPRGMTKRVAIEVLTRMDKEDERTVALNHELRAYPIEGAYALYRAIRKKYGFVSLEATPTFFGPKPPRMVGIDISRTEHVQVPWGRIVIGGIDGYIETGATVKPNGEVRFVLQGEVKRRDEKEANELVALVKHFLTEESIYRGKAVRVRFPESIEDFDFTYMPEFIDTSKTDPSELVFPKEVAELVETSLFTPIRRTEMCRRLQVPLKRGVLLEGPYGVGKTLTAYVTAKLCEQNRWTFIYLDKTADLKRAILLAQNYQPCVIFAEDIDQVLGSNVDRDEKMNDVLNTIDGIDGKAHEIIVVLTTNHVDKINRAMLRAGRLDAVIPVRPPDAQAVVRLVKLYSRGLLEATDAELAPVGEALAGQIPATIREAVERGKLAAVVRMPTDATTITLRPEDMLIAAHSMKAQLKYMEVPPEDNREPIEKAADSLAGAIRDAARVGQSGHRDAPLTNGAAAAALLTEGVEA